MDPQQQFCLKWNSFGNNLVTTFETLFKSESLTDVTLFCEGVTFKAHKIILAACSKHFQDLFEAAPFCPNILVILDGTSAGHMSALLEFMYKGEVHVSQEHLTGFLKAAESLQIKGLSMEQERLVGNRGSDLSLPGNKTPTGSVSLNPAFKAHDNGDASEGMHPPSSSPFGNSILPPYLHYGRGGSASPYDHPPPRKRHHRPPSDSGSQRGERASVLVRGGGPPERESPLPLTFSPISPHREFPYPPSADHADSPQSSNTLPFPPSASDTTAAVDSARPPSSRSSPDWRTSQEAPSNSCPEDLRVKTENRANNSDNVAAVSSNASSNGNSGDHNHRPSQDPDSNQHEMNHVDDWRDRDAPASKQHTPGDHGSDRNTTIWNSPTGTGYQMSHEISNAHKNAIATTTPTGKKLQCPYCERLYGYETNLRAHIRQRHQGIRAPCPYCSRTFTRNNTVRRHIAREHKTELNLTAKAFQLSQVQNHNQ